MRQCTQASKAGAWLMASHVHAAGRAARNAGVLPAVERCALVHGSCCTHSNKAKRNKHRHHLASSHASTPKHIIHAWYTYPALWRGPALEPLRKLLPIPSVP